MRRFYLWAMRRFIRLEWGARCYDYCPGCFTCFAWESFDRITGTQDWPMAEIADRESRVVELTWKDADGCEWKAQGTITE